MTARNTPLEACIELGNAGRYEPFGRWYVPMTERVIELSRAQECFQLFPGNGNVSHGGSPYFRFTFAMLDRTCLSMQDPRFGLRYGQFPLATLAQAHSSPPPEAP